MSWCNNVKYVGHLIGSPICQRQVPRRRCPLMRSSQWTCYFWLIRSSSMRWIRIPSIPIWYWRAGRIPRGRGMPFLALGLLFLAAQDVSRWMREEGGKTKFGRISARNVGSSSGSRERGPHLAPGAKNAAWSGNLRPLGGGRSVRKQAKSQ